MPSPDCLAWMLPGVPDLLSLVCEEPPPRFSFLSGLSTVAYKTFEVFATSVISLKVDLSIKSNGSN